MQGYELVNLLADHGFSLRVEGNRLAVSPASRLTDDIRQAIRVYKPAILELAGDLDVLIEAWRCGPRTRELCERLKAASVLQPAVGRFSYGPAGPSDDDDTTQKSHNGKTTLPGASTAFWGRVRAGRQR